MAVKKILTLGKSLKENIDDAYEKFITGGGKTGRNKKITIQKKDIDKKLSKQKQVDKAKENRAKKQKKTKKVADKKPSVKKLASDAKTKRNIKSKINKAEKVFSRKEYNKKLLDTLKSGKKNKTTALTVTKQPPKKTGTNLVTIPKGTNIVKKKTTSLTTIPKSTGAATSNKILNFLKKNKKKIAAGGAAALLPFAIGTDKNVGEGSISGGGNKDKKPKKDFSPKIKKPDSPKVKKQELPKIKSNDYTGRFIDKEGNVAYDSASDFFAHMFGTPKKRKMPERTSRIIGKGDKLKRKEADKKGAGKGVKFKAFKSGTKSKTIGLKDLPPKPKKLKNKVQEKLKKNIMLQSAPGLVKPKPSLKKQIEAKLKGSYGLSKEQVPKELLKRVRKEKAFKSGTKSKTIGLKDLPPKAENPGIHMLPAKAKMNMGFKPMFGGGLIASFYDKPAKTEKYKGNTTSARQVKGYGKAKKKA